MSSDEENQSPKRKRSAIEEDKACLVSHCERNAEDHLHARELRKALDLLIESRLEGAAKPDQEDEERKLTLNCAHRYLIALLSTNRIVIEQKPDKIS